MKSKSIIRLSVFLLSILITFNSLAQSNGKEKEILTKREASAAKKAAELLKKMTLEEKILQLLSYNSNGIPRLGIPNMSSGEALHGVVSDGCTSFPQSIALGATFDPTLVKDIAKVIAMEARAVGMAQSFSPMLAVSRDTRWGRIEESYGEDPLLVTKMGIAYINGLQGEGVDRFSKDHIFATPKHFVADGEPWAGMNGEGSEFSERVLREIYMTPFEAAIKEAGSRSIMPAHHAINGIPCHGNSWTLQQVLRDEWKFDGFVTSDMDDISKLSTGGGFGGYKYVKDTLESCIMAIKAGVDMELVGRHYKKLTFAIKDGRLSEEVINRSAERVLRSKILLLGLSEPSVVNQTPINKNTTSEAIANYKGGDDVWAKLIADGKFDTPLSERRFNWKQIVSDPLHDALALKAAQRSLVLLKNKNSMLPMDKSKIKKLLVVGSIANLVNLGGYSTGKPRFYVNVVDGLRSIAGTGVTVVYAEGCGLPNSQSDWNHVAAPLDINNEKNLLAKAVAEATSADVIVAVVGHTRKHLGENLDRDDLGLVGNQEILVKAMQATGKPVVVVFNCGAPISSPWIDENMPAILQAFYGGQFTGTAIAQAIFGDINPGGKMPITTPRNVGQVPCYYNHFPLTGPVNYYGSKNTPIYPFGYGLSYTTFKYSDLKISAPIHPNQPTTISLMVENTGNREGDEVVQLYIHQDYTSLVRPVKELKGFQRITLKAGEKQLVSFPIGFEQIKFWKENTWRAEPGTIQIMLGSSSDDIRLKGNVEYTAK